MNKKYDYIIIGAGVVGTSIANELSKETSNILVIDKYGYKNQLNASQDHSRSFRVHYDQDDLLINLAVDALPLWKELEKVHGTKILHQTGKLLIGEKTGSYAQRSFTKLTELGLDARYFDKQDLEKYYPQFKADHATLDLNGYLIDAYQTVDAFVKAAKFRGVEFLEGHAVTAVNSNEVKISGVGSVLADQVIVATGSWTNKLIDVPVKATKQHLLYLQPERLEEFLKINFPVFSYYEKGFYGLPAHGLSAMKIANHIPGDVGNPDTDLRQVEQDFLTQSYSFFKEHVPGLANAKLLTSKTLFYTLTEDRNFIIDRTNEGVVVATGFSGHGFKFAPIIGKLVKQLLTDDLRADRKKRFGLERFETVKVSGNSGYSL